jgi:hypothetical protein
LNPTRSQRKESLMDSGSRGQMLTEHDEQVGNIVALILRKKDYL